MNGLTLAQVETPYTIVLDWMLCDIKGEDFCPRLRRDTATARLPLIVITAGIAPGIRERIMIASASYYTAKSGNMAELVKELQLLIDAT